MLAWTGAGAKARPTTLQIRLQRSYPGRVRAGAPVPARSMPTAEVQDNLRYFTAAGPRVIPVDAVVFTGVGAASRPDLVELCGYARERGVGRVTLHAGVEDLEGLLTRELPVNLVVLPLQPAEAYGAVSAGAEVVQACRERGIPVASNTVLTPAALPMLQAVARVAVQGGVQSHGFTFPFPVDGQAEDIPPAPRAVAAGAPAVRLLTEAGVRVWLKGLPGCYLGAAGLSAPTSAGSALTDLIHRSANRWYVDADHQRERALMFFPDVVAFFKEDTCRFCALDGRCDGFFATFLRRPGFPPLVPVEAPASA